MRRRVSVSPRQHVPLLVLSLAVCSYFARPGDAAGPDDFGVEPGTDCSKNVSCQDLHTEYWDRPTCLAKVMARQRRDPRFLEQYASDSFFQRLPDGSLANTSDQMTLTKRGCDEFCGEGTFYWDAIPRLTTWIIPVVLLLSNLELSPIDKRRFMTVVHAVGDPIDSFWSLLHKIYVWRRLYAIGLHSCKPRRAGQSKGAYYLELWDDRLQRWKRWWLRLFRRQYRNLRWCWRKLATLVAKRKWKGKGKATRLRPTRDDGGGNDVDCDSDDGDEDDVEYETAHERARVIATVLAGFEEISGAHIRSELHYHMVLQQLGHIGSSSLAPTGTRSTESRGAWQEWRHCARVLADARTNEFLRTLLAIFIYVFGVVAALDDAIGGGNTSKPGGRIGSAVFLMWLVPMALLSNVVGTFTSRRTCLTIMRLFVRRAGEAMRREQETRQQQERTEREKERAAQMETEASGAASEGLSLPSPAISIHASPSTSPTVVPRPQPQERNGLRESPSTGPGPSRGVAGPLTPSIVLNIASETRPSRPSPSRPSATLALGRDNGGSSGARVQQHSSLSSSATQFGDYLSSGIGPTDTAEYSSTGGETPGASGSEAPLLSDAQSLFRDPVWESGEPDRVHGEGTSPDQQRPGRSGLHQAAARNGVTPLLPITSWNRYFNSLQSLGAIYTYRPWKIGYRAVHITSNAHYAPNWLLFLLATFPVLVSAAGAFAIIWYAVPIGWNCRHIWVVVVSFFWLLSVAFTTWMHADKIPRSSDKNPLRELDDDLGSATDGPSSHAPDSAAQKPGGWSEQTRWTVVLVKDLCVGTGLLALVFLSTSGVFNNCFCWSDKMWHNILPGDWGRLAFVPLNTEDAYGSRSQLVYGPVVYICLGAQLAFVALVVFLWWDGISVIRWDEEHRRREWRHEVSSAGGGDGDLRYMSYDGPSYLLFWYKQHEFDRLELKRAQLHRRYTLEQDLVYRRRSEAIFSPFLKREPHSEELGPVG